MPIERWSGWKLTCDGCGEAEPFTAEGFGYCLAETREEAEEVVRNVEGRVDGHRILCRDCGCKEAGHPRQPAYPSGWQSRRCLCGERSYHQTEG